MSAPLFPYFDDRMAGLNQFILYLVDEYHDGKINTWDDLDERVKTFFTSEKMDEIEETAPGWKKMASFADGRTLTHVTCVFLGLFMLPEFQSLTEGQQQLAKWIVLFHDIEKISITGKRDSMHMFRSAVTTAYTLPAIGFTVTGIYQILINSWGQHTNFAFISKDNSPEEQMPDNRKLPEIISSIDNMFGENTPAALIIKGVLLHQAIDVVKDWPQPAPLTDKEAKLYINKDLVPLLKVMHLADNDGWTMFGPGHEAYAKEIRKAFERVERLISQPDKQEYS